MINQKHVVGVVGNDIVHDARVRKTAAAAAKAGFKSTILCYTSGDSEIRERFEGVDVIKIPVPFQAHTKNARTPVPMRPFNAAELGRRHAGPRVYQQMKKRRAAALVADPLSDTSILHRLGLLQIRLAMRFRHDGFRIRRKAHTAFDQIKAKLLLTRRRIGLRTTRRFRDGVPNIADYEVVFGPVLEALEPDLIHAHDYHMIGLAVTSARNLRAKGRDTKVVYDAHELIEGLTYPPQVIRGWLDLERIFIRDADAVTGVSPEQAQRIRDKHGLADLPTVILNAPVTLESVPSSTTATEDLGIEGQRLLIYHGNVTPERGVRTLVEALPLLPDDVHVAVLAPADNPVVQGALDRALELNVEGRFHSLAYVPTEQLLHYISSADLAVIPYLSTGNNEIALPNKLFESLQAGLPVLVSNMESMSSFVREFGIGEVFESGSEADLADKTMLMLNHLPDYRSRITQRVAELANWDTQAIKLTDLYGFLLGVSTPSRLQITTRDIQTESSLGDTAQRQPKLAIGPRNMAGQAFSIASAVQRHLGIPAVSYSIQEGPFAFPSHHHVSPQEWRDPAWQQFQRQTLSRGFTHVIAESGTGILGSMNGGFIDQQAAYLEEDGIAVGVLLHGSDIRDPRRHRLLSHSPYGRDDDLIDALVKANTRLRRHLESLDVPFFVTTPDLLEDVDAEWVPVVLDAAWWADMKPPFQSSVPVVLHTPTNSLMKGSEFVDSVLIELDSNGIIRYLRPESSVPSSEVRQLIEKSDVVVDQLVIGAYGLMSCQAMAGRRIAIANTRDIGSLTSECPVVHSDPDSFRETMMTLLSERARWPEIGDRGEAFVRQYHDGKFSAAILEPYLRPDSAK